MEMIKRKSNDKVKRINFFFKHNYKQIIASGILVVLFILFLDVYPGKISIYILTILANQSVGLAFSAIAQTIVVLTSGIDLSVGGIFALSNCISSELVNGTLFQVAIGIIIVLGAGLFCGLINGLIVVYGKIQPIIVTLATSAIYTGVALFIRPITGGDINEKLSNLLTYDTLGIPTSLIFLIALFLFVWVPFKKTKLGRGVYAIGSSELAAYMSGVNVISSKLAAYTLAGFFSAAGGFFLSLQTLSGDAAIGVGYTLNSIAATVIGGSSLAGGVGGAFGSIIGAFILRTIKSFMFFTGIPPLAQPLFEGLVLLAALCFGAIRLIGVRNRLDILS